MLVKNLRKIFTHGFPWNGATRGIIKTNNRNGGMFVNGYNSRVNRLRGLLHREDFYARYTHSASLVMKASEAL